MSSMFLALCQRARREFGIAGSGPSAVTGQVGMLQKLVDWVSDANDEICARHVDWGFLVATHTVNTVVGEKDVARPSDWGWWDTDSFYLDRTTDAFQKLDSSMDYQSWRSGPGLGAQTNRKPSRVVLKPDGDLILHDPPDAIYSFSGDYWKTTPRLAANSDISPIPVKFERIILARAGMYWAKHEGAWDEYKEFQVEYDRMMARLEGVYIRGREGQALGYNPGFGVEVE